jgi:hypothetical protein
LRVTVRVTKEWDSAYHAPTPAFDLLTTLASSRPAPRWEFHRELQEPNDSGVRGKSTKGAFVLVVGVDQPALR